MAILKTANKKGKYYDDKAKEDVAAYILNPFKMSHNYCGGVAVEFPNIAESMQRVSERFGKTSGVQIRHFILSFYPNELSDATVADEISKRIVQHLGREYQTIYGVHEDAEHLHIHIAMNSVSYVDGHRYYGTRAEFNAFRAFLKNLLYNYGIYRLDYVSNSGE